MIKTATVIIMNILLILGVISTGNDVQVGIANKEVINNGGGVVEYNGCTYYSKLKNDRFSIAKIDTNKKKETTLIQFSDQKSLKGDKLYIYSDRLYYSFFDDGIYSMKLDGKDIKRICNGTILEMKDSVIFYQKYDDGFYKVKTDGKENEKLYSGDSLQYIKSIKDDIYFFSNDDSTIYRCNKSTYKLMKLTTESLKNEDDPKDILVEDIVEKGNYIYYTVGTREGSGAYWYGSIKRVKKNGTGKTTIVKQIGESEIGIVGNKLYFQDGSDWEWATYDLKTKKVKKLGIERYGIACGNYCYDIEGKDSEKSFNLYQFEKYTNKEGYKKIVTIEKTKDYSATLNQVERVGSWIYFSVSIMDYNKGGWRGTLITYNQYRVKTDGNQLTKLN